MNLKELQESKMTVQKNLRNIFLIKGLRPVLHGNFPLCRSSAIPLCLSCTFVERLVIYCRRTSASAAHATHCATFCTPCQPPLRAFSGWIRSPPPSPSPLTYETVHTSYHHGPQIPPPTLPPHPGLPWLERTHYIAPYIAPPHI